MKKSEPDYILLFAVAALAAVGLIMLASAGVVVSLQGFSDPYYFFKKQLLSLLVGLILAYIAYRLPYQTWLRWSLPIFIGSIILLLLVFVPGLGYGAGEARRWLHLGFTSLQPGELLKLSFVIYLAALFSNKRGRSNKPEENEFAGSGNGFLYFLFLLTLIGGLMTTQPDVGTFGVIAGAASLLYFLAGANISHLGILLVGGLAALSFLIKSAVYRANRWITFLHPEIDPQGIGYQINQALLALGSGGLFGRGLGQSKQKYNFLPEPITDSISAIIGEELGYIGLILIISLFLTVILRAFKIYKNTPNDFARLLAGGIACLIFVQAFVHLGAASGFLPMTGVPLPFISYGGSSLIVNLIGIGILLNISKST